ncbi:MAG: hypothetical protein V4629_10350 [Pseudomonadota bacterium]
MKNSLSFSTLLLLTNPRCDQGFISPFSKALHPIRSSNSLSIRHISAISHPSSFRILKSIQPLYQSDLSAESTALLEDFLPMLKEDRIANWFVTLLDPSTFCSQPLTDIDVRAVEVFLKGTELPDSIGAINLLMTQPDWKQSGYQKQIRLLLHCHINICNKARIQELENSVKYLKNEINNLEEKIQENKFQYDFLKIQKAQPKTQMPISDLDEDLDNLDKTLKNLTELSKNSLQNLNMTRLDLNYRQSERFQSQPISDRLITTVVGDIKYHVMNFIFDYPRAVNALQSGLHLKLTTRQINALRQKLHQERAQFVSETQPQSLFDALHRVILSHSLLPSYGYLAKMATIESLLEYGKISADAIPARKQNIVYTAPARIGANYNHAWTFRLPIAVRAGLNEGIYTDILGQTPSDEQAVLLVFDMQHSDDNWVQIPIDQSSAFLIETAQHHFSTSLEFFENFENDELWVRYPTYFNSLNEKKCNEWAKGIHKKTLKNLQTVKDYQVFVEYLGPLLDSHFPYPNNLDNFETLHAVFRERLEYVSNLRSVSPEFVQFLLGMSAIYHLRNSLMPEALYDNQPNAPHPGPYRAAIEEYRRQFESDEETKLIDVLKKFSFYPNTTMVNEWLLESLLTRCYLSGPTGANELYQDQGITQPRSSSLGVNEQLLVFKNITTIPVLYDQDALLVITLDHQNIQPVQIEEKALRFLRRLIFKYFKYVLNP